VREDTRSLGTKSITIDGHEIDLTGVAWKLENIKAGSVSFSVEIVNGETPVARIIKQYFLSREAMTLIRRRDTRSRSATG